MPTNPYESPQAESLASTPRRIAVGATLVLLSIPAASIAGFGTCMATNTLLHGSEMALESQSPAGIIVGFFVSAMVHYFVAWWFREHQNLTVRTFTLSVVALVLGIPVALLFGLLAAAVGVAWESERRGLGVVLPPWPFFAVVGSAMYAIWLGSAHAVRRWTASREKKA
jgi:hypothetical protein